MNRFRGTLCLPFALGYFCLAQSLSGITVLFSSTDGVATNLANSSGTVSNGLVYGILISSDSSFDETYRSGFTLERGTLLSLTLESGVSSDDKLWISGDDSTIEYLTSDTSALADNLNLGLPGDPLTGGPGGVRLISDVPSSAQNSIFALVWFDSGVNIGDTVEPGSFGILQDDSFILPGEGAETYIGPFSEFEPDPTRPATGGTLSAIPEPTSSTAIAAIGLALLTYRSRN